MAVRELTVTPPARTDLGRYRWAALLAVTLALASVAVHTWMLATMPLAPVLHVVVLTMAAACLWCGIRLIRTPRVHEWAMTAAMGASMVAAHLLMTRSHAPHHAMTADSTAAPMNSGAGIDPTSLSVLLALAEILVAVAVIWRLTARR